MYRLNSSKVIFKLFFENPNEFLYINIMILVLKIEKSNNLSLKKYPIGRYLLVITEETIRIR